MCTPVHASFLLHDLQASPAPDRDAIAEVMATAANAATSSCPTDEITTTLVPVSDPAAAAEEVLRNG